MKVPRAIAPVTVAVAASCLAAAPAALGAAKPVDTLALSGSHGYTVSAVGNAGDAGTVAVTAARRGGAASYSRSGTATAKRMSVDLGRFGRVKVRFRPQRTVKRAPPRHCRGPKEKVVKGVFKGTIRFKGEGGYTRVNARRAHGAVNYPADWRCHFPKAPPATVLAAASGDTSFVATEPDGGSTASFSATRRERSGAVSIYRSLTASAPASAFTFDSSLATAHVDPPSPFAGEGTYSAASGRLSGDLTAAFPGRAGVRLAGPATLTHGR